VRRVKGYTDQLPGRRLTISEWEVLSMVDRYHIVRDIINRSHMSEIVVMKALRSLINEKLVEIVTADQHHLVADRI
jgi:phosphoketolase